MNVDGLKIAFLGLGEAGVAIISGWGAGRAGQISAYDIKLDHTAGREEIIRRCHMLKIVCCSTAEEAVARSDIVFSCVTADQAVCAAENAAKYLRPGSFWCDLNSCAPSSKQAAAVPVSAAGGRYVDVAVMAPVHPAGNMVPLLISGAAAPRIKSILAALPMLPRLADGPVGRASSIKMVRSIMVKGLEALTAECALAASAAGVEDEVFSSLKSTHPKINVEKRAAYNFERSLRHGERRAAEMEEVTRMLNDLGIPDDVSAATVRWQRRIGELGADYRIDVSDLCLKTLMEGIISQSAGGACGDT